MEPEEFAELVSGVRAVRMMMGSSAKTMLPVEAPAVIGVDAAVLTLATDVPGTDGTLA